MANIYLIRSWRAGVVAVGLALCVAGLAAHAQNPVRSQTSVAPVVIAGEWPRVDSRPESLWLSAQMGDAKLRVATEGVRVVSTERVSGPNVQFLEPLFASIRTSVRQTRQFVKPSIR